jgi:hypothetical protein
VRRRCISVVLLQTSYLGIDGGCMKEERKRGRVEEKRRLGTWD